MFGIDPSEGQLAYARTRPGTKLAKFQMAGAQDLPFADNSFDAAVMPLVISFVPDPVKAVAEMKRVVRPGGMIAAYMWDVPGGGLPLQPVQAAMRSMGAPDANPPGFDRRGLAEVDRRIVRFFDRHLRRAAPAAD